jgi:hypothetical protein
MTTSRNQPAIGSVRGQIKARANFPTGIFYREVDKCFDIYLLIYPSLGHICYPVAGV